MYSCREYTSLKLKQYAGYSLPETFISVAIGTTICMFCAQHLLHTLKIYLKIQQKFAMQQNQLIAQYYLNADLHKGPVKVEFAADEQILHLQFLDHEVEYSVRKNELFRDDLEHNAVALVKNVLAIQTQLYILASDEDQMIITIIFTDQQFLELMCILKHKHIS